MHRMKDFLMGFAKPLVALKFLLKAKGVRRYTLLPVLLNVFVYIGIIVIGFYCINEWDWTINFEWNFLWGVGEILGNALNWLFATFKWLILLPLFLVITFFSFRIIGMTIGSVPNCFLSEKVELFLEKSERTTKKIIENDLPESVAQKALSVIKFIGKEILLLIVKLLLVLIPVVGVVLVFLFRGYFTGIEYIEIPISRNNISSTQQKYGVSTHIWEIIGFGVSMELLFIFPLRVYPKTGQQDKVVCLR